MDDLQANKKEKKKGKCKEAINQAKRGVVLESLS